MKNIYRLLNTRNSIVLFLSIFIFVSCKKDTPMDTRPPQITGVTTLADRTSTLESGRYSQWVLIKGINLSTTNKVDFNGVLASDSLIWANDTSITVKIPGPLPGATDNPITVYTNYGQATYNFVILQPPPVITSFDPVSGAENDVVTIKGDWFTNLVDVKFGTATAEIVSSTKTEIKVKVPANVSQSYIYVTTSGGTTQSTGAFGFKFIIYDDAMNPMFWTGGWGGTANYQNTVNVKRGTHSVHINFAGGYGAPMAMGGGTINLADYTALKISVFGAPGSEGLNILIVLNGSSAKGKTITVKEGEWTDFTIPLSELGSPAMLDQVWIVEWSGRGGVVYVDDLGLI